MRYLLLKQEATNTETTTTTIGCKKEIPERLISKDLVDCITEETGKCIYNQHYSQCVSRKNI